MDQYKNSGKVDPDYESYNSALELNEEEDKKENLIKIKKIIEDAFNTDIIERQEHIEQVELRICKARKLLHLLRYALIMSYYKKKELEYNGNNGEASTSDSLTNPDKQDRIHPAIKKLLGKNVHNLDHLNIKDKRKSSARSGILSRNRVTQTPTDSPESKKIKLDLDDSLTNEKALQLPKPESNLEFIRSRKKIKHRIIVGNISKWMPSSEDDILTHKWMVYVRGPIDKPDVSHFIDKVVFYLHPSYKPHDVVEVSDSPFHLSRRGWGEFPVRVQIFFKVTLNKPIDIVHNIKLDKTYSGRQTLGNETLVDVFLYDDNQSDNEIEMNEIPEEVDEEDMKIEICDEKIDCEMTEATTSIEHDYCSGSTKMKKTDHSYSLPFSHEGLPKPKKERIQQDETNVLIYGLEAYCPEQISEEDKQKRFVNNFKQLILNRKDIKFSNTKIIVFGKKIEGSILSNFGKLVQAPARDIMAANRIQDNVHRITLPENRFKNMGEALPYLFKRLPLCSELANNVSYKRLYPFTAGSLKEFVSWNVGMRRSSEWSRARAIKKILLGGKIQGADEWNTKTILMFGRSHDYTPYISYSLFNRDSEEKTLLMTCYSDSCQITKNSFSKRFLEDDHDVTVNVDSDSDPASPKKIKSVDISDPHTKLECSFISQTALDCGIILKQEEIVEGVKVNAAEMMILEAVKCLANNLIRRAKNHRVCTRSFSPNTSAINREDVEVALNERPEMFSLREFRSERRNEYF